MPGILLSNCTNGQYAGEHARDAALEWGLIGQFLFEDRKPIKKAMREVEEAHDLVIIRRNLAERLE
jgi:hypothetical protein